MPDTVTPMGPLPGDQDVTEPYKYMHDTDCLYWARGLFQTYRLVGGTHPELRPSAIQNLVCTFIGAIVGQQAALRCRIGGRRRRLDALLNADFPNKYLGMAVGLTIDWIWHGWIPEWQQFIRKIHHDGTRAETRLYGDGKWNTLYVLIEAYRFTHDDFYMNIFDNAWRHFEALAENHPDLNGFFPDYLDSGDLASGVPVIELLQEVFLDVIVDAYLATVEAGQPRADYLAIGKEFANKILAAHEVGTNYYWVHNGILGRALVRLAVPLRKV